jgi:hypothetical protein
MKISLGWRRRMTVALMRMMKNNMRPLPSQHHTIFSTIGGCLSNIRTRPQAGYTVNSMCTAMEGDGDRTRFVSNARLRVPAVKPGWRTPKIP